MNAIIHLYIFEVVTGTRYGLPGMMQWEFHVPCLKYYFKIKTEPESSQASRLTLSSRIFCDGENVSVLSTQQLVAVEYLDMASETMD